MKSIKYIIAIIAASILFSGCISVDGYFKNVRNKVFSSVNGDFQREVEFAVGPALLTMSSIAVSFSDAPEFTDDMLRKIERVQIGVYKNRDWRSYKPNYNSLKNISSDLIEDGYEVIVRSSSNKEMVAILVKSKRNRLNEMFVIAINEDEMVMTQIFGDLEELVEIAIRSKNMNFEYAKN